MQDPSFKFHSPRYEVFQQVTIGKVIENKNFYKTGRVKVLYEAIGKQLEVEADVLQMWFGKESYRIWIPQVGMRVLIGLIGSALHFPVVIGVLTPINNPHSWEEQNLEPDSTREIIKTGDDTFFIRQEKEGKTEYRVFNEKSNVEIKLALSDKYISVKLDGIHIEKDGVNNRYRLQAEEIILEGKNIVLASEENVMIQGKKEIRINSKTINQKHQEFNIKSSKLNLQSARSKLKG